MGRETSINMMSNTNKLNAKQDTIVYNVFLCNSKKGSQNELLPCIADIRLTRDRNVFHWNLDLNGQFPVKSHYFALIGQEVPKLYKYNHLEVKGSSEHKYFSLLSSQSL